MRQANLPPIGKAEQEPRIGRNHKCLGRAVMSAELFCSRKDVYFYAPESGERTYEDTGFARDWDLGQRAVGFLFRPRACES